MVFDDFNRLIVLYKYSLQPLTERSDLVWAFGISSVSDFPTITVFKIFYTLRLLYKLDYLFYFYDRGLLFQETTIFV